MKQYTTPDQTAKLIELGFKPPMWRVARKFDDQPPRKIITSSGVLMTASYEDVYAYSIGELIELIPPIFTNKYKCDCYLNITHDSAGWVVDYTVYGVERPYIIVSEIEFIDSLFAMISMLYETGFYDFETKRYIY